VSSQHEVEAAVPEEEEHEHLDRRIVRSSGWLALSLGAKQGAAVLTLFVLARLIPPEAFGVVSLAWAALAFAEMIQESGVSAALVYRRDDIKEAAASGLIWGFFASLGLYGATFLLAPLISHILRTPDLTNVLRVLGLVLLFRGVTFVPAAILERELNFRGRAKGDLAAAVVQLGVSIGLAASGADVWSLVGGAVAAAAAQAAVLWLVVPWRPALHRARVHVLREMMRYGRYVGIGNVLNIFDNTIDNIVIARMLGTTPLGYYTVAFRLAEAPHTVLGFIVARMMFPVYAKLRDDLPALRRVYVQTLQRISMVALPVSVGLIVAAKPLILALLGEKWLVAETPLRILAVYGILRSLMGPAGPLLNGIGKPHYLPGFSAAHLAVAVPVLYGLINAYGLTGAALGMLLSLLAVGLPNVIVAQRQIGVSLADLLRALAMPALCSALLGCALALLLQPTQTLSPIVALVVLIIGGLIVFAAAAAFLARDVVTPFWMSLRGSATE
jgi:PST family polysaccharide transporter/lipopolysaccharide exporter